jgi:hypothetical protein
MYYNILFQNGNKSWMGLDLLKTKKNLAIYLCNFLYQGIFHYNVIFNELLLII